MNQLILTFLITIAYAMVFVPIGVSVAKSMIRYIYKCKLACDAKVLGAIGEALKSFAEKKGE